MVASKIQVPDELIVFLDNQITNIEQTLYRLDRLRAAVIRRDDGSLEELMEEVRDEGLRKKQTDLQMRQLQVKLSSVLECPPGEVNMTRLCEQLTGQDRGAGIGGGGEGYTSWTIASPTGEGLTTALSFTRERRCTLKEYFRIV